MNFAPSDDRYLIGGAVEAVPTAALSLHVGLGLTQLTGQTAYRLRRMRLPYFELNIWNINLILKRAYHGCSLIIVISLLIYEHK